MNLPIDLVIGVAVNPGSNAFTRIQRRSYSSERSPDAGRIEEMLMTLEVIGASFGL
jgi:hypothetical protein